MTKNVKPYGREELARMTRKRSQEEKIGEKVQGVSADWKTDLQNSPAEYVLLGIPEDIGVRANYGRAGAATAFKPALESFLNQQSNAYLDGAKIIVLGEIQLEDLMEAASQLDMKNPSDCRRLRELTGQLDERVSEVVQFIVSLGKLPLIVGGGHNNAYGNIRGASQALNKKLNVINCDPHLDFRPLEGRHSGNGFSYAYEEGFLNNYAVLAMHEQYNNQYSLQKFRDDPQHLFYITYESVFVREQMDYKTALKQCIGFVQNAPCGLEIDLDAITNVPSSAKTSSGISPMQARQYIHFSAQQLPIVYLHIAEGAPVLSHIKADNKTGKLIAYLLTDFIKAREQSSL